MIDAVARATAALPLRRWGFGESIAMEGLLAAGGGHRRAALDVLAAWAAGATLRGDPLAHVTPGVPLLEVPGAAAAARRGELAAVLEGACRGRHGARLHRPDLPGWEHEVWVDCMHLDGPFLARLARRCGDRRWADAGADLLLTHARALQDERSGLFSHGFDDAAGEPNGVAWGRGQGWALLGLVATWAALPDDHAARPEIAQRLRALAAALGRTEAEPGRWHTVVDAPDTYLEASVSAFCALGLGRGARCGTLDADAADVARRSLDALIAQLAPDGRLPGVSDATPVGPDAAHYGARPTGCFPWGQGPALLALAEAEMDRREIR